MGVSGAGFKGGVDSAASTTSYTSNSSQARQSPQTGYFSQCGTFFYSVTILQCTNLAEFRLDCYRVNPVYMKVILYPACQADIIIYIFCVHMK